jgi:TonB family protein
MIGNSQQWEGQIVEGKFLLARSLGGSDGSAVFLVEKTAGRPVLAVVHFVDANIGGARDQLDDWEAAAKLNHPNLIQIFEPGRCQVAGHDLFYVLTEYAEENLAQIIPERPLTADETRQVLDGVVPGLAYIHGQGLVHGRLKPSNIFAIGDTVKVSSDTVRAAGKLAERAAKSVYDAPETSTQSLAPSGDVWSLGVTLVEVLTQHPPKVDWPREELSLPESVPQLFREVAENCLQIDPERRWTLKQIAERLQKTAPVRPAAAVVAQASQTASRASSQRASGKTQAPKWPYAIALLVAVVLIVVLIARPKPPASESTAQPASEPGSAAAPPESSSSTSAVAPAAGRGTGQVAERVMPRVSPGAQRTVQGKIRIQVEVNADEKGNVTSARLKSAGPSRYFAERSLEAAKGWKFRPPVEGGRAVSSRWLVKFAISRGAIDDSVEQIKP